MTGILEKFHVEHGVTARKSCALAPDDARLPHDEEIDTAIQLLKDDLDACGREMKRLLEVTARIAVRRLAVTAANVVHA